MEYLHEEQYYIDLYNLHTIEECLDWYKSLKKGMDEKKGKIKDLTPEEYEEQSHRAISYAINVIKIQRFRHKKQTIAEWMERDRAMQEKFDNANPPEEIYCHNEVRPRFIDSKSGIILLCQIFRSELLVCLMLERVRCLMLF